MTGWQLRLSGKQSPVPLYAQLADAIEHQIASGDMQPGDRLPSERDIADLAGISRMTARQALTYLAERGIIEIRHGVGTFVAHPKLTSDPLHLLGFTEQMMAIGGTVTSRVLAQDQTPASPAVAAALQREPGEPVIRIQRLRSLNGTPMLLETSFFPRHLCAGIETIDLSNRSLYATLERTYGVRLTHAQQSVEAIAANAMEASLFGLERGAPMLLLEGVAATADNQPGESFKAVYRGDRFKFALRANEPAGADEAVPPIHLVLT